MSYQYWIEYQMDICSLLFAINIFNISSNISDRRWCNCNTLLSLNLVTMYSAADWLSNLKWVSSGFIFVWQKSSLLDYRKINEINKQYLHSHKSCHHATYLCLLNIIHPSPHPRTYYVSFVSDVILIGFNKSVISDPIDYACPKSKVRKAERRIYICVGCSMVQYKIWGGEVYNGNIRVWGEREQ